VTVTRFFRQALNIPESNAGNSNFVDVDLNHRKLRKENRKSGRFYREKQAKTPVW